ncbi:MAG: hypothetical protein ACYSWP_15160 [Planctomycetota bacterium]
MKFANETRLSSVDQSHSTLYFVTIGLYCWVRIVALLEANL